MKEFFCHFYIYIIKKYLLIIIFNKYDVKILMGVIGVIGVVEVKGG